MPVLSLLWNMIYEKQKPGATYYVACNRAGCCGVVAHGIFGGKTLESYNLSCISPLDIQRVRAFGVQNPGRWGRSGEDSADFLESRTL